MNDYDAHVISVVHTASATMELCGSSYPRPEDAQAAASYFGFLSSCH
jgi:hypothetical protein